MVDEPEPVPEPVVELAPLAAPITAHLSASQLQELIDWARAGYPHEACGVLAGDRLAEDGGRPTEFHALRNAANSPYRYELEPEEQLRVQLAIEDSGQVVWGIFHSHVATPAEPSPTDVGLAFYPDSLYLICSLADETAPEVRAWTIRDGLVTEVPVGIG